MSEIQAIQQLKVELMKEIEKLEAQVNPLQEALRRKREKLDATDRLLSLLRGEGPNGTNQGEQTDADPVYADGAAALRSSSSQEYAPTHVYWPAILHALERLGGRGRSEQVTDIVGELIKEMLKPADYERLPSGVVRWRNRVAWQRLNMVNEGLLKRDSPRGIWEWTEKGRTWITAGSGAFRARA